MLVGPSGCGKSTLLRIIAGLEKITDGTLTIDGKVANNMPPKDRNLSMVFQNYALYPHMTVKDNILFGLDVKKVPKSEQKRRLDEAAEKQRDSPWRRQRRNGKASRGTGRGFGRRWPQRRHRCGSGPTPPRRWRRTGGTPPRRRWGQSPAALRPGRQRAPGPKRGRLSPTGSLSQRFSVPAGGVS